MSLEADDRAVGMARIRPHPVDPFEIDHDRAERLRLVAVEDDLITAKKLGYLISPAYEITLSPALADAELDEERVEAQQRPEPLCRGPRSSLSFNRRTPRIPLRKHPRRGPNATQGQTESVSLGKSLARPPVA